MLWPLILGGAGVLKSLVSDIPREQKARQLQAETARYSPWTNINPLSIQVPHADVLGGAIQGGLAGATLDQSLEKLASEPTSKLNLDSIKKPGWLGVDTSIQQPQMLRFAKFGSLNPWG